MGTRGRLPALLMLLLASAGVFACGGDTRIDTATTAETAPSPADTPTPEATATPGVSARTLEIQPPAPLPEGLVLVLARGCWGCDGPHTSIDRFYRDASGQVRHDVLFDGGDRGWIFGGPVVADNGLMYVSTCSRGYCGYLGEPSQDAQTSLFRSDDGGISWQRFETLDGPAAVTLVAGDQLLLDRSTFDEGGSGRWERRYETYPGGSVINPPPGSGDRGAPAVLDGTIAWFDASRQAFVDRNGSPIRYLQGLDGYDEPEWRVDYAGPIGDGGVLRVSRADGDGTAFLVPFTGSQVLEPLTVTGELTGIRTGWPTGKGRSAGNLYISLNDLGDAIAGSDYTLVDESLDPDYQHSVPAIIDFDAGVATPLELFGPLLGEAYARDRNLAIYAEPGAFLRAVPGVGDCLNVRDAPSLNSGVIDCYLDGVLLRDRGEAVTADGTRWLAVETPLGEAGWAAAAFLQR